MKRYLVPGFLILAFGSCAALGIFSKVISDRCDELREKQALQENILLKQSEIIALNAAILQKVVSLILSIKPSVPANTEESGFKLEKMKE